MEIIPAIDLMDGQVVRLKQGRFDKTSIYNATPEAMLTRYLDAGAAWVHIVNLDAARGVDSASNAVIESLLRMAPGRIELGGGIHTADDIDRWLSAGAGRVILGSAVAGAPKWAADVIHTFGSDRLVAGIDCRDGHVAVRGWLETTPQTGADLAKTLAEAGFTRAIVTDIATDGMLTGPNFELMKSIARISGLNIIVSGGVSGTKDLETATALEADGIEGVIIGRAIYEGQIDISDAVAHFQHLAPTRTMGGDIV